MTWDTAIKAARAFGVLFAGVGVAAIGLAVLWLVRGA